MVGIASAAIYSVLEPISDATGLTLGDLNAGTGYMFLGQSSRTSIMMLGFTKHCIARHLLTTTLSQPSDGVVLSGSPSHYSTASGQST